MTINTGIMLKRKRAPNMIAAEHISSAKMTNNKDISLPMPVGSGKV